MQLSYNLFTVDIFHGRAAEHRQDKFTILSLKFGKRRDESDSVASYATYN